jgi:hypothetical protein
MLKTTATAARFTILVLAAFSACRYPKYADYVSVARDFRCRVPYEWNVKTENDGSTFSNANFIGPFDPDFFMGVPSFSVRWHGRYKPHIVPDRSIEMYAGPDDYIKQTLDTVYPKRQMKSEVSEMSLPSGLKVKLFQVLSPAVLPKEPKHFGVSEDVTTKETVNLRRHAYVLFPTPSGFYVLIYPATQAGYPRYEKEFNQLVRSFTPLTDGPGGAPLSGVAK